MCLHLHFRLFDSKGEQAVLAHFQPHSYIETRTIACATRDRLRIAQEHFEPSRPTRLLDSIRPPWDRNIHRGDEVVLVLVSEGWLDLSLWVGIRQLALLYLFI